MNFSNSICLPAIGALSAAMIFSAIAGPPSEEIDKGSEKLVTIDLEQAAREIVKTHANKFGGKKLKDPVVTEYKIKGLWEKLEMQLFRASRDGRRMSGYQVFIHADGKMNHLEIPTHGGGGLQSVAVKDDALYLTSDWGSGILRTALYKIDRDKAGGIEVKEMGVLSSSPKGLVDEEFIADEKVVSITKALRPLEVEKRAPVVSYNPKGPQPGAPAYWFVAFSLRLQAWHATDILIVNEGEEVDGKVTVEEVLHGSKTVGDELEFPGLAKLTDPKERTMYVPDPDAAPMIRETPSSTEGLKAEVLPGKRMILFLGGGGKEIVVNYTSGTMDIPPKPANINEHPITRNVVLIDGERLFTKSGRIDAPIIPFVDLGPSLPEARKAIAKVLSERARIERCAEIDEAKRRAAEAAPLMGSENSLAFGKGFEILIGCGVEANPHVEAYIDENLDKDGVDQHMAVWRVTLFLDTLLGDIRKANPNGRQGGEFVPLVMEIADKEMAFWQREAPALGNWWKDSKYEARAHWYHRLQLTVRLVRVLAAIDTLETRQKIAEIRDFCKSQPQLMDGNGAELYRACLKELGEPPIRR